MSGKSLRGFAVVLAVLGHCTLAREDEFYVAPGSSSGGDGSVGRPWDLATALAHPSLVKPGDTIWLRGGTYRGSFTSTLTGTSGAPIKVRQHPGERATIDGNHDGNEATLIIMGSFTWYWGFEVTNSDPTRTSATTAYPPRRGEGVNVFGPGTKLINLVVHDTSQGIGSATPAENSELYGNLIYYNGYDNPGTRGHGHGIYVQNQTGTKRIVDNMIFEQFGWGIHAY